MPSFTSPLANLVSVGPIVEVFVSPSQLYAQAATKAGKPLAQPIKAVAMIDTGASG